MQGRSNGGLERKGPHKSMHCKFCKPPGVIVEDKTPYPQMETKTKIHLVHEGADLTVYDIHDEPGTPRVDREACICVLEGDKTCSKCAPDKTRPPQVKKVCRCPRGAKPHPSLNESAPQQKKEKVEDNEFWWEKYSREHDALTKETWAAYMAQRKKDKKLIKCQREEKEGELLKSFSTKPLWFQKLSCQQILYVEYLSTAIRLDSDENVTDRTFFILGGLGLYPRPTRKTVKKCLKFCRYNALQFLNQLLTLTKEVDIFNEKKYMTPSIAFTWNESLLMNAVCHLELPAVLREIMDRMPPLPRQSILPQIPYPVFRNPKKVKYETPYDEPLWKDSMNWVEKNRIDRINKAREYMETKRVKIPPLALVRRPSLIDSRPNFLAQIEANEKASRRQVIKERKKTYRKHHISTFNSAVDVTAIAGIEASEVSTTDKADTEDICVFLREPKRPDTAEEDHEPEEFIASKDDQFTVDEGGLNTQVNRIRDLSMYGEYSDRDDDMPFRTPPKRESGTTIKSPCPPPEGTPGPPVTHYEKAKRETGILTKDLCAFHPLVSSSTQTVKEEYVIQEDVEEKLKSAAEKLKKFADDPEEEEANKISKKKKKKKRKGSKKRKKSKRRKKTVVEMPDFIRNQLEEREEEQGLHQEEEEEEANEKEEEPTDFAEFQYDFTGPEETEEVRSFRSKSSRSRKSSEISDPDPDPDSDWPPRPVCLLAEEEEEEEEEENEPEKKRKCKKKKCKWLKKKKNKKTKGKVLNMILTEEVGDYFKKPVTKENKETMTECYPGEFDYLYKTAKETVEVEKIKSETEVYTGDPFDLVKSIIEDLAEEGFLCASYDKFYQHEDIIQLISYLQGEIIDEKLRKNLMAKTRILWSTFGSATRPPIPQLNLSAKKLRTLSWNDKKWLSKLAKKKLDEVYFFQALSRASTGKQLFLSLHQTHFGTDRYLKAFYGYMVSKYEDCVLRGIE